MINSEAPLSFSWNDSTFVWRVGTDHLENSRCPGRWSDFQERESGAGCREQSSVSLGLRETRHTALCNALGPRHRNRRGWQECLLIMSSALGGQCPFSGLTCTHLILWIHVCSEVVLLILYCRWGPQTSEGMNLPRISFYLINTRAGT